MSKITFRADDDLVNAVESLDESKSEVMRDALRAYLESQRDVDAVAQTLDDAVTRTLDGVVAEHVDELVDEHARSRKPVRDVNVNISVDPGDGAHVTGVDGRASDREVDRASARPGPGARRSTEAGRTADASRGSSAGRGSDTGSDGGPARDSDVDCPQCGASVAAEHAFCPNCGGAASRPLFCECGDEIRADWAFCPHCGRRTASAGALDR